MSGPKHDRADVRRLLVLDVSYGLEFIRANKIETSVTCRDLGGYFEHVWTVHPFAALVSSEGWSPKHGRPAASRLAPRHVFIDGKIGRFEALANLQALNFLLAQGDVLAQLVRLVRENDISVIRAGDCLLMGLYGWAIARTCKIPLLVRVGANHERVRQEYGGPMMPNFFRSVRVERAVERFVLSRADLVAGANDDNLRFAIASGAREERTTLFRYGNLINPVHLVDPAHRRGGEDILAEVGLAGRPFLLCISRLDLSKRPDDAVRTLARVRAQGIDVALLIAGSGRILDELQQLAAQLGVAAHVVFVGNRDQEWLARVIPHAAVVLSPFTGRALVEVAFAGAPTVAYDVDWQGELVRSGVNGELIPVGDVAAMANATISLLTDRDYARRMGNALRETALDMMAPERLDAHERAQYDLLFDRVQRGFPPR